MQVKSQKTAALTIGISLIVMALSAGIAVGNLQPQLWIKGDATATAAAWSTPLFSALLFLWGIIILTDALVSWSIAIYYKRTKAKLAIISSALRWIYTLLLTYAVFRFSALFHLHEDPESGLKLWEFFEHTWYFALIIFGLHLLSWGYLAWKDGCAPKWLSVLLMLAGLAYFFISILKYGFAEQTKLIENLEMVLMLPMIVGELGMGIWLLGWGWEKTIPLKNN